MVNSAREERARPGQDASLGDWLAWQQQLHPRNIDMGLERVADVAARLLEQRPAPHVITVGGTNGKGSTVALLERMLRVSGYRVASYTSPHLLRYNERLRIDGEEVASTDLCRAFARVEAARGEQALTYFEYGTLAALWLIQQSGVDVALLEVGLGGRLDAVNIVDADVSIITNIGLDHRDWLGPDREAIGREKAGIMRRDRVAVCCDRAPPLSLVEAARQVGARLQCIDTDFEAAALADGVNWQYRDATDATLSLPLPALPGRHQLDNAAGAITALQALALPGVTPATVARGLQTAQLLGRLQRLPLERGAELMLDVAHNSEGCQVLADYLRDHHVPGTTVAVFAALADKPVAAMRQQLQPLVQAWHYAGLPDVARGLEVAALRERLEPDLGGRYHADIASALAGAVDGLKAGDRLLVFGSFHTVAAALQWHASRS